MIKQQLMSLGIYMNDHVRLKDMKYGAIITKRKSIFLKILIENAISAIKLLSN